MKAGRGFTLIELIVVVAVIGILATISIIGFGRYQAQTRDANRVSSATVITEALEKYYNINGEYPSCPRITQSATVVTGVGGVLQGLDTKALVTPNAPSETTNSITCTDLTSINSADYFAYVGDGSNSCTTGNSCLRFTNKEVQEWRHRHLYVLSLFETGRLRL